MEFENSEKSTEKEKRGEKKCSCLPEE